MDDVLEGSAGRGGLLLRALLMLVLLLLIFGAVGSWVFHLPGPVVLVLLVSISMLWLLSLLAELRRK